MSIEIKKEKTPQTKVFSLFFTIITIPQNEKKFKTVIMYINMLYKIRGV